LALLFVFGDRKGREERRAKSAEKSLVILRKRVAGLSDVNLARFVARAGRTVKLRGAVNLVVTGSNELRALNRRFRGKDQPTDVLSFVPDPDFVSGLAGDIAISAEIAKQNARRLGHSTAQEIKILVLHGVLHLAGYDHECDHGVMAGKEAKLRQSLGLPVGLIERNGGSIKKKIKKNLRFDGRLRSRQRKAPASPAELRSARTGRRPVPTQTTPQARTR
jgi:probable rRNA maturation factor